MDITKLLAERDAANNRSNTLNANIGSDGTNEAYDKAQGNRGKQMNPNWRPDQRKPGAPDDEELDDGGEIYGPVGGAG
jgi:hypothetical protein